MNAAGSICCCLVAFAAVGHAADDFLDAVDDALTVAGWQDNVRARLSGTLDLEGYQLPVPAPGVIFSDSPHLFNPRLSLFLDVQAGARVYLFAQARADRGFDPSGEKAEIRLDEYALRLTSGKDRRISLQVGKFATVVGNWVQRHDSWGNPFVTAPLPYENLTGIWDTTAAGSGGMLLVWSHVRPSPFGQGGYEDKYRRVPIIWGPSYGTGAAISGLIGRVDYAIELKNTALSSRPDTWNETQNLWRDPTVSGRLGFRPTEMWNLGFSASAGTYLRPLAEPTLPPGRRLADYRETVLGQDVGFAWHQVQLWAEIYEARFAIPQVGNADTTAYYVEAKYKVTPQFFGAVRWNQQVFGTIADNAGVSTRWGRNVWRVDLGPVYRFTPHTQFKLQYSVQHESGNVAEYTHLVAGQFTVRF
jgi:hypothetical protein